MKSLFSFLFNFFTKSIVVLLVAMLSVNYFPDHLFGDFPFDPKSMDSPNYDSVIPEWNNKLSQGNPEFIQVNNLLGPESIAISKNGLLYTGLADGRLVELDPKNKYKIKTVLRIKDSASLKDKCQDNVATRAEECGRLLQLRFVNDTLYGLEASSGLYMMDVKSGSKILLGPKAKQSVVLYNSFVADPQEPNLFYVTVSSRRWSLLNIMWSILELETSGQVLAFDTKTGKHVIVMDNLMLPNGIDVDSKRDQILFSETMKSRVSSIPLGDVRRKFREASNGDKLSGIEISQLIPLLPGNPDNIVVKGDLAYIALPFVRLHGREFIDHMTTMPSVRKSIGRFMYGVGKLLEYVHNNFYQCPCLETTYRELMCGHFNYRVMQSDRSAVLEYQLSTGASRLFGSDTFGFVSEAVPDNKGNLYLGSFRSPFIVRQKFV